jgi:hypothetical protein
VSLLAWALVAFPKGFAAAGQAAAVYGARLFLYFLLVCCLLLSATRITPLLVQPANPNRQTHKSKTAHVRHGADYFMACHPDADTFVAQVRACARWLF